MRWQIAVSDPSTASFVDSLAGGPLSVDDLREWVERRRIPVEWHPTDRETPTVPSAAEALGVRVEQIIKSLVFLIDGEPYLTISNGETRVSDRKLASLLGVGRSKVRLAPGAEALRLTGYAPGVMPPFGHHGPLSTLVDPGVVAQPRVYGGTGDPLVLLSIEPAELVRRTDSRTVDIVG